MRHPVAGLVSLAILLLLPPPGQGESYTPRECLFETLPYPEEDSGSSWGSAPGPQNLSCYRLPEVRSGAQYQCVWDYEGPRQGVSHFLRCCSKPGRCCYFAVGGATRVEFSDQDNIPLRRVVSFWVESRGPEGMRRSPYVNVTLSAWTKYDPPLGNIQVTRRRGQLLMEWTVPEGQGCARVQFRQRTAGGSWELGDCAQQDGAGPQDTTFESCLWPLEAGGVREFQIRRQRGREKPEGPWSEWSSSVCSPLDPPALPVLNMSLQSLGPDGRRQLTLEGQLPQPALPEGCHAEPTYHVHLHMLSCPCKTMAPAVQALHLGRSFNISGAAYSLTVAPQDAGSPNQTWYIPAQAHTAVAALDISTEPAGVRLRWPGHPRVTYCVEWEPQSTAGGGTSCTLVSPQEGNYSGTLVPGTLGGEACLRVTIFGSKRPGKVTAWSSVLSAVHFGGNASAAAAPQHVSVWNVTSSSASVSWTPPALGACSALLRGYVVRYREEEGHASEHPVEPPQTLAGLHHLRPGRPYTVQVRANLPQGPGAWSQPMHFRTDDAPSALSTFLAPTGSFVVVFLLGVLGYLGLRRASRYLCPPLPMPCASSAVQLPDGQWKQSWFWVSPEDFLEEASLQEALAEDSSWEQGGKTDPSTPGGLDPKLEPLRGTPEPTEDTAAR